VPITDSGRGNNLAPGPALGESDVRELRRLVDAELDGLNEALLDAERRFVDAGVNVPASVLIRQEDDAFLPNGPSFTVSWYLNFGKLDGRWALFVERTNSFNDEFDRPVPIRDTSRELRVLAARALPNLYSELCLEMMRKIQEIREAKATAQSAGAKQ